MCVQKMKHFTCISIHDIHIHTVLYGELVYLLKRAGEVAALSFKPSDDGFIVKTTCRLFIIYTNASSYIIVLKHYYIMWIKLYNIDVAFKLQHYEKQKLQLLYSALCYIKTICSVME